MGFRLSILVLLGEGRKVRCGQCMVLAVAIRDRRRWRRRPACYFTYACAVIDLFVLYGSNLIDGCRQHFRPGQRSNQVLAAVLGTYRVGLPAFSQLTLCSSSQLPPTSCTKRRWVAMVDSWLSARSTMALCSILAQSNVYLVPYLATYLINDLLMNGSGHRH